MHDLSKCKLSVKSKTKRLNQLQKLPPTLFEGWQIETTQTFHNVSRCEKMTTQLNLLIVLLGCVGSLRAVVFKMEAENYAAKRFHNHREKASGEKAVNFNKGQSLNFYFCLRHAAEVSLNQVVYSNDGGSDTFEMRLDGKHFLGSLKTPEQSNGGKNWNKFLYSGQKGPNMTLESGRHTITLEFKETDRFGIDVDFIEVSVNDEKLRKDLFECAIYCIPGIEYKNGPARDDMPSASVQRIIAPVTCPSDDNIIIPIYHENIKHYLLTATLPKYRSFENHYTAKDSVCNDDRAGILWSFPNLEIPMETFTDGLSGFTTVKYHASNISKNSVFSVTFQPVAEDDFDKGSNLKITFHEPKSDIYVEMKYKKRDGTWSESEGQYITPQSMDVLVSIPSKTWSDTTQNEIEITLLANPETLTGLNLDLRLIKLREERRREYALYNNLDVRVVVIDVYVGDETDREKMAVKNEDMKANISTASFISVYQNTQWSSSVNEVLRLHQNGRLQLLPASPHGFQGNIPFGTSVFIGAHDTNVLPPKIPIEEVTVVPEPLQLFVSYKDGSKATLQVKTDLDQTNVLVKDVKMTRDPLKYPFATISSMWQYDGNSDIDHVSTNGNVERHVMNGWTELYGTNFAFFRKCISKHNTLSPDIQLQLINNEDLYMHV